MTVSVLCHCSCNHGQDGGAREGEGPAEIYHELNVPRPANRPKERGLVSYNADVHLPLLEPPIREGKVWHMRPEDGETGFQEATLFLHPNGICVRPMNGRQAFTVSWSPFSLVQACRLHTVQADEQLPWLRLFKVSVFHHGVTHFFATQGEKADTERARWVADVSRALRLMTQSLFPAFSLRADPLPGAAWTAMRLLAGYLLLCDDRGVSLVYCELHAHWDGAAQFAAYEDEYCDVQVVHVSVDMHTCVSERVGVDCSCLSLGGHHFNTRTCAEKMLWLRAISNVKVKLRHQAANPTPTDLKHYRAAILEYAHTLATPEDGGEAKPMLPQRVWRRTQEPAAITTAGSSTTAGSDGGSQSQATPLTNSPGPAAIGPGSSMSIAATTKPVGIALGGGGPTGPPSASSGPTGPPPPPGSGTSNSLASRMNTLSAPRPFSGFQEPDGGDACPPPAPKASPSKSSRGSRHPSRSPGRRGKSPGAHPTMPGTHMGPVPALQLPLSGAAVGRRVSGDAWTPPYSGESSPSPSGSGSDADFVGERDSAAYTTDDEEGIWKEEEDRGDDANEEEEDRGDDANEDAEEDKNDNDHEVDSDTGKLDAREDGDDKSTSAVASPDQHSVVTLAPHETEEHTATTNLAEPIHRRNETTQRSSTSRRAASCSRYQRASTEARRHLGIPVKGPTRSL